MNSDQRANLDAAVLAVGESLALAWSYFHVLRGIDNGRLQNPSVVQQYGFLYDRLWRAVFDGFFAKVGTVMDTTRNNHSLPNLLTLARRYASPELKPLLPKIEEEFSNESLPLAKLKRWRHEMVAHRPAVQADSDFHSTNRMTLTEVQAALEKLDEYVNQVSMSLLSIHSEHRSAFEGVTQEAEALFAACARGIFEGTDKV
jgi:hypothetical protein